MIVCSQKRYLPVTNNMLVLQQGEYYFYVHRDVYDKAVILYDRYQFMELKDLIDGSPHNNEAASKFFDNAPAPLKILGPFLTLVNEPIDYSIENATGVLSAITSVIDVRNFIKFNKELRKSVDFSLSVQKEYQMSWDRFFYESMPYEERNKVEDIVTKLTELLQNPMPVAMPMYAPGPMPMSTYTAPSSSASENYNDPDYDPFDDIPSIEELEAQMEAEAEKTVPKINDENNQASARLLDLF